MARPLEYVEEARVDEALRAALDGSGPAVFAGPADADIPSSVPRRVALVVQSSGSTGRPKRVALSSDALLASAAASESALGEPGQWVLALPTSYIAGINVLVRSYAAGTRPVQVVTGGFGAESFLGALDALDPRMPWFTSLVPVQLGRLLDDAAATSALARFSRVLVGGQATPAPLLARAASAGIRLTRTYGSSETSGGCVYDGVPFGTVSARIVDGEVQLGGPVLAEGYLDDPARTEAAFVVDEGMRWYRTDDAGRLDDGVLAVLGRRDDVIISGGLKVSLGEIEQVVREELPDAVVLAEAHAEWGQVPVVIATTEADLDALRSRVVARLGRAAAPHRMLRLDAIPMLPSGKPDRVSLRIYLDR